MSNKASHGEEARARQVGGSAFAAKPVQAWRAEPPLAWAANAPLLRGERGVHIASRLGIVAVEDSGEPQAERGSPCCRRWRNGPACPSCRMNERPRGWHGGSDP
jgi:hypothetical protein